MSKRLYNKLYVNKNREEGSEKILLGYQHDQKEIRLKKDSETYFHVPHYTAPIKLTDSSLIVNGATGGAFPAASDRIFKSQKNYGKVTEHGDPTYNVADGAWFCSWLYKDEYGNSYWLDRLYNPGNFVFAGPGGVMLTSGPVYKPNNPVFRDVPSRLMLEPSVLYKYFHVGERTAEEIVQTFSGQDGSKLLLNFSNWGEDVVNTKSTAIQPKILTQETKSLLYKSFEFSERPSKKTINLNGNNSTEIIIDYNSSYNPTNEFTATGWFQSSDWNKLPSTQLFGNSSSKGGYGVFVQNLSSYPFFVVPETFYGHILYVNEKLNGFLDKSIQLSAVASVDPAFTAIDYEQNVIVCNRDSTGTVYKLDNAGNILASSKTTDVAFNYINPTEVPLQLLIGPNNTIVIRTHSMIYTLDSNLNKIDQEVQASTMNDVAAYEYNIQDDTYELVVSTNVKDSKFIETTQWFIGMDGNLYRKFDGESAELYYTFTDIATTFTIDPQDRLWVLHGNNSLSIFDSRLSPLTRPRITTDVGLNVTHNQKNISFICAYDRETSTYEWKSVVFYSNERYMYVLDMNGDLLKAIDSASLFDSVLIKALNQQSLNFRFFSQSDFTGYEHRRVFKNLSPYNNKPQLVLKAFLKDGMRSQLTFDQFVSKVSLNEWPNDSWQHLAIVLQNKTFRLYVNGELATSLSFTGRHSLSYDLQPLYFIGTSGGSQIGFNQEIQSLSQMHKGLIGDLKIYNYAVDSSKLKIFLQSFLTANDVYWNMPIPLVQYVEKIERMFKNKVPGSKSALYKVKIRGTKIQDLKTREIITEHLQAKLAQMHPGYTDFLEVEWVD